MGTREDGSAAPCIVREVQQPQRQQAAGGGGGEDSDATEEEEQEEEEAAVDPEEIVYVVEWLGEGLVPTGQLPSLRRAQLVRPQHSPLAALTRPLLQRWVETVAVAEPVAVRLCWAGRVLVGRGSCRACMLQLEVCG